MEDFLTARKIKFAVKPNGLLRHEASENEWGQVYRNGIFENPVKLSIRALYRLWLEAQRLLDKPWEALATRLSGIDHAATPAPESVTVSMATRL